MPRGVRYRPIPGYAGYRVGSDSSIWCNRPRGRLTPDRQPGPWRLRVATKRKDSGYWVVTLSIGNRPKQFAVHQLVLLAFRGPPPPGTVSRHRDGNKDNNLLRNLMYATQKVNIADKKKHGTHLCGERANGAKLTDAKVADARRRSANGEATRALARELNVDPAALRRAIRGEKWAHVAIQE